MTTARRLQQIREEQQARRRAQRLWDQALGGRTALVAPVRLSGAGSGGALQTAIQIVDAPVSGQLLLLSATGQSIASGGDLVDADTIVYQHGFAGVTSPGEIAEWPADAVGAIQVEWAWDSYTGDATFQVQVDGVVPPWGTMLAASGASGFRRRGVHIGAGAEVEILVTQTSGSPQTGDFTVEYQIQDPTAAVVSEPPPGCYTDEFAGPASMASIDGRITDTGGGIWQQDDGSTLAIYIAGAVSGIDLTVPPPPSGLPKAVVNVGYSDGTILAHCEPIQETNAPAFRNGVMFRHVDDDNYWAWYSLRSPVSGLYYALYGREAGAEIYNSGILTTGVRDTGPVIPMMVVLNGDSIDCYYDGVLRHSINDSTHQTATEHGVTTLGYGVQFWSACPPEE